MARAVIGARLDHLRTVVAAPAGLAIADAVAADAVAAALVGAERLDAAVVAAEAWLALAQALDDVVGVDDDAASAVAAAVVLARNLLRAVVAGEAGVARARAERREALAVPAAHGRAGARGLLERRAVRAGVAQPADARALMAAAVVGAVVRARVGHGAVVAPPRCSAVAVEAHRCAVLARSSAVARDVGVDVARGYDVARAGDGVGAESTGPPRVTSAHVGPMPSPTHAVSAPEVTGARGAAVSAGASGAVGGLQLLPPLLLLLSTLLPRSTWPCRNEGGGEDDGQPWWPCWHWAQARRLRMRKHPNMVAPAGGKDAGPPTASNGNFLDTYSLTHSFAHCERPHLYIKRKSSWFISSCLGLRQTCKPISNRPKCTRICCWI